MVDSYIEVFSRILAEPSRRCFGPAAPPAYIAQELSWSGWFNRIASDPFASVRRVSQPFLGIGR